MFQNPYSKAIIKYGVKYGKAENTIINKLSNKLRNLIYSYTPKNSVAKVFCYETGRFQSENFYRLNLPREISNEKVLILQAIPEYKKVDSFINKFLINPIFFSFGSFFLFSICCFNSLLTMVSGLSGACLLYKINKIVCYNNIIINSIYLKSCGTQVVINTLTDGFEADILKVRRLRMTEFYLYRLLFPDLEKEFTPIVVNYEAYLIPKSLEYVDKEVLNAVSNSCYVQNF